MTAAPVSAVQKALQRLGRLSTREIVMLGVVLVLGLGYFLGTQWVQQSVEDLQKERVRLAASEVSLANLTGLLGRQDEILARAGGLLSDYRSSKGVEPSSLVLQRIDRMKGPNLQLRSIYPMLAGQGNRQRFRVELAGTPESLGELFHNLGEGAPPILIKDCALSVSRARKNELRASATMEVHEEESIEEMIALLERRLEEGRSEPARADSLSPGGRAVSRPTPETAGSPTAEAAGRSPTEERARALAGQAHASLFPYKFLRRRDLFHWSRASSPTGGGRATTIADLTKSFNFSGVIWEDDPVVIVQDGETGQVYYRHVGEYIGELEIREVGRTFTVLGYKDEELRLE